MLVRFTLSLTLVFLMGCQKADPTGVPGDQQSTSGIDGAWFSVNPFAQELIAIEFTDGGKVIMTRREGTRDLKSVTLDYSILEGQRVNIVHPTLGVSEMATYQRKGESLSFSGSGSEFKLVGDFRAAGNKTPRELYEDAYKARIAEQWKFLNDFLASSQGLFAVATVRELPGLGLEVMQPSEGPIAFEIRLSEPTNDEAAIVAILTNSDPRHDAIEVSGTARFDPWNIDLDIGQGRSAWTLWLTQYDDRLRIQEILQRKPQDDHRWRFVGRGSLPKHDAQTGEFTGWDDWFRLTQGATDLSQPKRDWSRITLVLVPDSEALKDVKEAREDRAKQIAEQQRLSHELAAAAQSSWQLVSDAGPSARENHAMAYDVARERVVLFGGYDGSFLGDTWEWDGTSWVLMASTGPPPRSGHAMVYDASTRRVLMFGGQQGMAGQQSALRDTWEWNGSSWKLLATDGPSARWRHSMAFDASRKRVVLSAGYDGSYERDTWEWDGTAWSQMSGPSSGVSMRIGHAMAYSLSAKLVVLFGGRSGTALWDTLVWDGSTWTRVETSGPSARAYHAMAYDTIGDRILMFGGWNLRKNSAPMRELWEWGGASWRMWPIAMTGPVARQSHAMTFDSKRGRLVLFGGNDGSGLLLGDTWEWDGPPSALLQRTRTLQRNE